MACKLTIASRCTASAGERLVTVSIEPRVQKLSNVDDVRLQCSSKASWLGEGTFALRGSVELPHMGTYRVRSCVAVVLLNGNESTVAHFSDAMGASFIERNRRVSAIKSPLAALTEEEASVDSVITKMAASLSGKVTSAVILGGTLPRTVVHGFASTTFASMVLMCASEMGKAQYSRLLQVAAQGGLSGASSITLPFLKSTYGEQFASLVNKAVQKVYTDNNAGLLMFAMRYHSFASPGNLQELHDSLEKISLLYARRCQEFEATPNQTSQDLCATVKKAVNALNPAFVFSQTLQRDSLDVYAPGISLLVRDGIVSFWSDALDEVCHGHHFSHLDVQSAVTRGYMLSSQDAEVLSASPDFSRLEH